MEIKKSNQALCKYMFKTSIEEKCKETISRNCKAFGYLDGYFDEVTYENNFENSDENRANYEKGYLEGLKERLNEKQEVLEEKKKTWIKKLASYDGQNGIKKRPISSSNKSLYLLNYYKAKCINKEDIKQYLYSTEITETPNEEQQYTFGYLDGYFDEMTYNCYLTEENDRLYSLGYSEGLKDREKAKEIADLNKIKWLVKLAIHDSENNVRDRFLSKEAMEIYIAHYQENNFSIEQENIYNKYYQENNKESASKNNKLSEEEYLRYRHNRH